MEGQTSYKLGLVHMTKDRDNKWKVDYIVDSCLKRKKLEYLVHWKGYDNSDHTWEPKSNLRNAKDAIRDFHASHSSTPCTLSIVIDLVQTCTYHMIVYKSQEINWHPQSDSLGVSPSKQT